MSVDIRPAPDQQPIGSRRRGRRRRHADGAKSVATWANAVLVGLLVVGAPLACGAVHRPILLAVLGVSAVLALAAGWLAFIKKSDLKPHLALAIPILFLVIAALQVVPVPAKLRALIDPVGSELLALAQLKGAQPLSLDPPATYFELAKAAAGLCVGLAALVLSSGRRMRFLIPGLVAAAGILAMAVGFGHRAFSTDKIYGLYSSIRGLSVGPFINPNHGAEFLELAAFAALAFAFARPTRDGQRVWKVLAAVLAAGALSYLSRGSVLALGGGALTWFLLAPRSEEGEPLHRTKSAAGLIGLVVVAGVAIGFGADELLGRFGDASVAGDVRLAVWRDALKVIPAHPAGIGMGAFSRVYPVYQSVQSNTWFQFPENLALGFLIETGIPGALLLLAALVLTLRLFIRNARRDRVEASLAAGLVAVSMHNLTDFGLETPGVLLPFCAILGSIFGRQVAGSEETVPRRSTPAVLLSGTSAVAAAVSVALVLAPSSRNFDELLKPPLPPDASAIARAASMAHPTDHVYALAEARLAPSDLPRMAARLRMLNRAIILCPRCTGAHVEAARDLWRLGRRRQALLEWKTILNQDPDQLAWIFGELAGNGAQPAELMTLANDGNRYEVSRNFLASGMIESAKNVLATAGDHNDAEFHLVRGQIALRENDLKAARLAGERALAMVPDDPRAVLMASEVDVKANDRDKAIEVLQRAVRAGNASVEVSRKLLNLLMQTDRWQAIDRALADFRAALATAGAPMLEANLNAAHIYESRGQYRRAISEYQAALAHNPDDIGLRLALARAAEQAGSVTVAIDAYDSVLRRAPDNGEARNALDRIRRDKKVLEVNRYFPTHTGQGVK